MDLLSKLRFTFKLNAFVNLVATSRIIYNSSIYQTNKYIRKRDLSLSASLKSFAGERTVGNYTAGPEPGYVFREIIKNPRLLLVACRMLANDFKLLKSEWEERYIYHKLEVYTKGQIRMLYTFDNDATIKKFRVVTDSTNNEGYSSASFVRTQDETGLFSGYIDCRVPDDGAVRYAGFASIMTRRLLKSFGRAHTYNWTDFTHLVLKVRGDGRTYLVILGCPYKFDLSWQDQFQYPLYTRGGPYWQIVKIPFSNFVYTSRTKIQDQQQVMPLDLCSRIGITIADGIEGPFKLEIDYLGLERQPFHKHICPYESYAMKNVADL